MNSDTGRLARFAVLALLAAAVAAGSPGEALAQVQIQETTVTVPVGKSRLIQSPAPLDRLSIAEVQIAEAVPVSGTEIVVNGKSIGSTSLLVWGTDGSRRFYTIEVTVDSETIDRNLADLFPDETIEVTATGSTLILSGRVSEESVARRALELAASTGAAVLDNLAVPAPRQILLQVRMAEVNRTAMRELGINILRVDPLNLRSEDEGFIGTGRSTPPGEDFLDFDQPGPEQTFSDAVNFFVFNPDTDVSVFIRALKTAGLFKSLAEPNLIALDGKEASFLAGGEFPFPVVQGGQTDAVTIVFKEFGIRLNFLPEITNSGNIRLKVEPEVSSLDFASGLTVSGFQVPTILARRAVTEVELRDGQTFAIAGLIDNSITDDVDRVPILGDIPILGALFRSQDLRQNRSELLVLVTPRLVEPADEAPPIPTGEPEAWDWISPLDEPLEIPTIPAGDR